MIKEQVDSVVLPPNLNRVLAPHECKANAQFNEKLLNVFDQTGLDFPLVCVVRKSEEVEELGVLQQLMGKIRLWSGQCPLKICERFPLSPVEAAFDVKDQHVSAPAIFDGSVDIPKPFCWIFDLVQEDAIVEPRQLCSRLLHN